MKLSPDLSKAFNSVASKNDTSSLSFRRTQSCPELSSACPNGSILSYSYG